MHGYQGPRPTRRAERGATVLVASVAPGFEALAGAMLAADGYAVAYALDWEAAWLTVTRTQPAAVLCDVGTRGAHVTPLLAEALARGLPLLLAHPRAGRHAARAPEPSAAYRVAWLPLPLAAGSLRDALDALGVSRVAPVRAGPALSLVPRRVLPRAERTGARAAAAAVADGGERADGPPTRVVEPAAEPAP